jgi:WD40 repeat protein
VKGFEFGQKLLALLVAASFFNALQGQGPRPRSVAASRADERTSALEKALRSAQARAAELAARAFELEEDPIPSTLAAIEALRLNPDSPAKNYLHAAVQGAHGEPAITLGGLGRRDWTYVNDTSFSPDGRLAATISDGPETSIWVWENQGGNWKGAKVKSFVKSDVLAISWHPDGSLLAVTVYRGESTSIHILNTQDWREQKRISIGGSPSFTKNPWSPDGRTIATVGIAGIELWDRKNWEKQLVATGSQPVTFAWNGDGSKLAAGLASRVEILDSVSGVKETALDFANESLFIQELAWSSRSGRLAVGFGSRVCRVYQTEGPEWKLLGTIPEIPEKGGGNPGIGGGGGAHLGLGGTGPFGLAWHPDGDLLTGRAGAENGWVWHPGGAMVGLNKQRGTVYPHQWQSWSKDGNWLAVPANHEIMIFRAKSFLAKPTFKKESVAWSPGSRWLAGIDQARLYIWSAPDGRLERSMDLPQGAQGQVRSLQWQSGDRGIGLVLTSGKKVGWETTGWSELRDVSWLTNTNGKLGDSGPSRQPQPDPRLERLKDGLGDVRDIKVDLARKLAAVFRPNRVEILGLDDLIVKRTFPEAEKGDWSPDGRWLWLDLTRNLTPGGYMGLSVFRTLDWQEVFSFRWEGSVTWSPKNEYAVIRSTSHNLLNTRTWTVESTLTGSELNWSPDGNQVAVINDGKLQILNIRTDRIVDQACRLLPRNLRPSEWKLIFGSTEPYRKTCDHLPPGVE